MQRYGDKTVSSVLLNVCMYLLVFPGNCKRPHLMIIWYAVMDFELVIALCSC